MSLLFTIILLLIAGVVFSFYYEKSATRQYPAIGEIVDHQGATIHFQRLGVPSEKMPVLLIHGASCNLRDMEIAFGSSLTKDREAILVDRPGHGFSSRLDGDENLAQQAQRIATLLDKLAIKRVIICGQSYGGAVALALALQRPDLTGGMMLLAPVSHPWPGGVAGYNHMGAHPFFGSLFARALIAPYGALRGRSITMGGFAPNLAPQDYFDRAGVPLLFRPAEFQANSEDLASLYPQIVAQSAHYHKITAPVRLLSGTHDTAVLASIHCNSLMRELPNAKFDYVDGVGHPLHHFAQLQIQTALNEIDQAVSPV